LAFSSIFGAAGRALKHSVYRRYMIGHTLSATARWMKRTAVGWLAWELTHSATWLGIVAFADLVPMMIFVVLSGAIADRVGLMRIVKLSQILSGLISFVFAALVFTDLITIEAIVVLSVCFGAAEALSQPARMAAVHGMVPREDLSAAIALGGATFNASRMVGPAIAGALIIWTNSGAVLALCGVIFFIFYRGMQYVYGHTSICFLITLMVAVSLFIRPIMELMSGVSGEVFDAGPAGLSLLLGSIGAGALLASLWLARRGEMVGLTKLVTLSILGCGLALALAMAFGHLWLAVGFLMVVGAFMLIGNVGAQSLIQNTVDAHIRARVLSLFIVFAHGLPAIGALLIGWIASHVGLQVTLAASGLVLAMVWLWARLRTAKMAAVLEKTG